MEDFMCINYQIWYSCIWWLFPTGTLLDIVDNRYDVCISIWDGLEIL